MSILFREFDWPNASRVLSTTAITIVIALTVFYLVSAIMWGHNRRLTVMDLDRRIGYIEDVHRWEEFRRKYGDHVKVGLVLVDLKDSTAAVVVPGPKLVQLMPLYAREAVRQHYAGEPFRL